MSFSDAADAVLKATNRTFGTTCTYTYLAGGTSSISGVFDNAFVEIEGFITKKPTLRIRLADLDSDPVEGDEVTINSTEYTVRENRVDSFGGSLLILEKN